MVLLALDTTLSACSVALWDAEMRALVGQDFKILGKGHGEAIGPMVQDVLTAAGIAPSQISKLAVTHGPGTFTGLRIGLSLAHGLAAGLKRPVLGINTLAATAAPLIDQYDAVAVVHQAGATGKFYAGRFARNQSLQHSDAQVQFATLEDCLTLSRGAAVIGTGADAVMAASPTDAARVWGHDLPKAAHFAPIAATFLDTPALPQPLYLREADAKPSATQPVLKTRLVASHDVDRLATLHAMGFAEGWAATSFASALSLPGASALVLEQAGAIRGFVQFQTVLGETEINTICVEPRWRKRGFAKHLLHDLRQNISAQGATKIHLDVAEDNVAALQLYRSFGFVEVGRRKGYYARSPGDAVAAILMSLVI